MTAVFVDTDYWIAVVKPNDQWKDPADRAKRSLGQVRLLTTDEVLAEFLNALGKYGGYLRTQAVEMVRAINKNANITVVPQSRDSFVRGLATYENRSDKDYSLTDCISFNTMKAQGIQKVLSHDHHFQQESFVPLICKE